MKKFMMSAIFQDGTVDLCTVIEDKNQTNGCTFYRVVPADGNEIIKDEDFIACDTTDELTDELLGEYHHLEKITLKEMET
jgi:hypothetical protein